MEDKSIRWLNNNNNDAIASFMCVRVFSESDS